MKKLLFGLLAVLFQFCGSSFAQEQGSPEHPNIIMIAVDDLNDWVGFLDGNLQTKTPNMDAIAGKGMIFKRAYCAASVCNPSRAALMSGFRPSTSGIYENGDPMFDSPVLETAYMLPEWLSMYGYYTLSRGKIYHNPGLGSDTWDEWSANSGSYGMPVETPPEGYACNGMLAVEAGNSDWGGTTAAFEDTPDYLNAKWAADILINRKFDKPFFMACGIFRPHLSWFVPQEYFDKFPVDDLIMPVVDPNDLDDIPGFSPSYNYLDASKYGLHREAVQAYLASINYADDCIGVIIDALNSSRYKDNTIVILWGDHGWHLGEKLRYKKFTLWEESCRVPLVIMAPGVTKPASYTKELVNLIDLYPTIVELAGLPPNSNNEGRSLVPLLQGEQDSRSNSWTTMGETNYTIRSDDFRFIQRKGIPEEFYHNAIDPYEHRNQLYKGEYVSLTDAHKYRLDSLLWLEKHFPAAMMRNLIPGVIQAEKFDRGGAGDGYHDSDGQNIGKQGNRYYRRNEAVDIYPCNDLGGGFFVSEIKDGEWLRYTIAEAEPGIYDLLIRIAQGADATCYFDLYLDEVEIYSAEISFTSQNGWQDMRFEGIDIPAVSNAPVEIRFRGGNINFNHFTFVKTGDPVRVAHERNPETLKIYQQPHNGFLHINISEFDTEMSVDLVDMRGCVVFKQDKVIDYVDIKVEDGWKRGIYVVRTTGKHKVMTEKIMII